MNFSTSGSGLFSFSWSSKIPDFSVVDDLWDDFCWFTPDDRKELLLGSCRTRRRFCDACPPCARRCELPDSSWGSQFSLSESPDGEWVTPLPVYCNLARLEAARPSFGFLPLGFMSDFVIGELRLLAFAFKLVELVERSRLIAATAEPLDSFSACIVSSSRASVSQQNSHVLVSRDRPLGIRGMPGKGREALPVDWLKGRALKLRLSPPG
jgi:hypothetical protein